MILLCGIPSEAPLALVRTELERLGIDVVVFNQRRFAEMELDFTLFEGRTSGELRIAGEPYALEDFQGVYTRVMDDAQLPELRDEPPDSALRAHSRALHDTLAQWYEVAPTRVVNRARPQGSNGSKPYQAQLICAAGFSVPETLVTNDPALAHAFLAEHGRVVYKSISGVRSIVQTLEPRDLDRLERIRWCPVQFQAFVSGTNVRVHVVDREVFATAVRSEATDYRYATSQAHGAAELEAVELAADVAERCVRLAAALELPFAGVDLKLTPAGETYCFEVNPSPAFSYFEYGTEQPIAAAVARYLAGA